MTVKQFHSPVQIRDIEQISGMKEVEELQREVWGLTERDIVPLTQLKAARHVGGTLIGAFDGQDLVGFVYGFVGYENSLPSIHSHMLAVKPEYRNFEIAYKLKLAQRERALAIGIQQVTWTFDPLQALNAHFNLSKLGAIAREYKVDFYGTDSSSFLHHNIGTDRLWVTWLLSSARVLACLNSSMKVDPALPYLRNALPLVEAGIGSVPVRAGVSGVLGVDCVSVEIPLDIRFIQEEHPQLAMEWRLITRWAFVYALTSGYIVDKFLTSPQDNSVGIYYLSRETGSMCASSVSGD